MPPPVMVAAIMGLGWLLARLAPVPLGGPRPTLALAVMLAGVALSVWTVVAMLRAGTDPRPDKPDQALVARGPFRFSRNPIYLGFLLVALGFALHGGLLWPWIAVATCFLVLDRMVVTREERYLRARFGAAYEAYAQQVRRWV